MRFVMFYHSLVSDWNHGNAHFLRGVVSELQSRGHDVTVAEPADGWSRANLLREHGAQALEEFQTLFPNLQSITYTDAPTEPGQPLPGGPTPLDLHELLCDADAVLVHEWNSPALIARIGEYHRQNPNFELLFHDTHHRAVSNPEEIAQFDLSHYDAVLAFGESLRRCYCRTHPHLRSYTWHEAADTRVFRPQRNGSFPYDLVWVGNWGDGERSDELHEFLLAPARQTGLRGCIHGVRYPEEARQALHDAGLEYKGWLPNYRVPQLFSQALFTVHVPRRPYVRMLPGIPTIRVFEALACGIPLISAPWVDTEGLFTAGKDYLVARDCFEMQGHMRALHRDPFLRGELAAHGLQTVLLRHTCANRVDELLDILQ